MNTNPALRRNRPLISRWAALFATLVLTGCAAAPREPANTHAATERTGASEADVRLAGAPGEWMPLFDGQTLRGWRPLTEGPFEGHGNVRIQNRTIILERGRLQTGVAWAGEFPRDTYEVSLEAMRIAGYDFFCGMTFPAGEAPCTLIIGGWGGSVVGLSNVDDQSAVENETTGTMAFENDRWYRIRLRVTPAKIEAWIDTEQVIDLERGDHGFSVWYEQEPARPFGITTWDTGSALRNIRVRRLVP